jgi:hypothetical protein
MSVAAFRLQDFIAQVKTKGLARVNRFEVIITPPPGINVNYLEFNKISLLCEVSNFPPINLSVKPFKIFGPSYQRPITSEYGGDGMSMTFHVDREMNVKRFFDDWMENIVRRDDFTVNYQSSYATTLKIKQLDEGNLVNEPTLDERFPQDALRGNFNNIIIGNGLEEERNKLNIMYEIELLEAFPRSMTLMDLNNSAQNQTHRLNIIFAYRYWRRTDIPESVQLVPKVSIQTQPVLTPIRGTETSRVLAALSNQEEPNVDFSDSTFSVPSA